LEALNAIYVALAPEIPGVPPNKRSWKIYEEY